MSNEDEIDRYWAQLYGQAQVPLTGASSAALRAQLFDVLTEFFDGSNCWREVITFMVVPDTLDYPVMPLEGGRVLRLLGVLNQYNTQEPAIMSDDLGSVRFIYPYTEVQPMSAYVVKTVTDPLKCFPPNIPDWLLPKHYVVLLHGVLGNMMLQPGNSYSNAQLSNFHQTKFRDGIAHARVASMRANTVGAQAWAYPQQFRVTSQKGGVSTFNVHPTPTPR